MEKHGDFAFPLSGGGLDLGSGKSDCARLGGSKVASPLGVVKEEVDSMEN